jgi:hypothetical protein
MTMATPSLDKILDRRFKDAVQANIGEALKQIATLRLLWPKLCTALNTTKAARLVLNAYRSNVSNPRPPPRVAERL